jgi:NIMA (never in mitosis gene a)-related kinase
MALAHRNVQGILQRRGYTEVNKIGEGSFGKAILVKGKDGSKAVCKMVDVSKASAKDMKDAAKEGQVLSTLKHPYIVRYRENFTESGWFCIIMDYCDGGDLTKPIDHAKRGRGAITEERALRWFTQASLALKYIHDRHILHRDLKPGNFFLMKDKDLKMGDFGIAKVLSSTDARARTQIGTPYYLSPEVCQEKPYAWSSDIWAMGCILYELCALKVPFDAPNMQGLVQKITRGPIPSLPSQKCSPFVREIVGQMLDRNPNQRPSVADILKRSQIQDIVRQMLGEAQEANSAGGAAQQPVAAHQQPPPATPGLAAAAAAPVHYQRGDLVEYYSATHNRWVPATVANVDASGSIVVDLKPNSWISKNEQAQKVRRRKAEGGGANGYPQQQAAVAAPAAQRSPAAGQRPAMPRCPSPSPQQVAASPVRQRSPSVGPAGSRAPSPSAQPRSPSPGPGGVGATPRGRGRENTPSRAPSPSPGINDKMKPPCIPKAAEQSPLRRRNFAASAAGGAIAGGFGGA